MRGRAWWTAFVCDVPFSRSHTLPEYADHENLTARLADGVLTIRIPKQPKAKPRKIQISNGHDSKKLEE